MNISLDKDLTMRTALFFFIIFSLSNLVEASTSIEKSWNKEVEQLNQDIQKELLYGDVSDTRFQNAIFKKINLLRPLADKSGGKRRNFQKTLRALSHLMKNGSKALDIIYPNGLTGRQIVLEATDPEVNRALKAIYDRHKTLLSSYLSGHALKSKAMTETLLEIQSDPRFDFLNLQPEKNYVLQDQVFNFIADKCLSPMGEEDFYFVLFGFQRCQTQKYRMDRWTVGLGYYNATAGYSYLTGLKIGKKDFYGVGARVKVGVSYAGGIGVFIGNGLMFNLDLEKAYGLYAGVTYINIKPK
jgi:hypothetical protein